MELSLPYGCAEGAASLIGWPGVAGEDRFGFCPVRVLTVRGGRNPAGVAWKCFEPIWV